MFCIQIKASIAFRLALAPLLVFLQIFDLYTGGDQISDLDLIISGIQLEDDDEQIRRIWSQSDVVQIFDL